MAAGASSDQEVFGRLQQAVADHRAGRLGDALAHYRAVLADRPDNRDALNLGGMAAFQSGDASAALSMLGKAVAVYPDFADAQANYATVLLAQGDAAAAETACRRALDVDPNSLTALFTLANLVRMREELGEAAGLYRRVLALAPDYVEARANLANLLREQGNLAEAATTYRAALAARSDPQIMKNLANVLQELGALDDAVAMYRQAIAGRPDLGESYNGLTNALMQKGDLDGAMQACRAHREVDPGGMRALANEAMLLNELGDRDAAGRLLDFDRLLAVRTLEPPPGYADRPAFHAALIDALRMHPSLRFEPNHSTTRQGHQTADLTKQQRTGPIGDLLDLIERAVADRLRAIEPDPAHPFLADPPTRWRLNVWGTLLAGGGHQLPHIHPFGWMSGVYYVRLPDVADPSAEPQAGWIEFGRPGADFHCRAAPLTRMVQPHEGMIVMFPSYFYHRTVPFSDDTRRVSVAFDVVREN